VQKYHNSRVQKTWQSTTILWIRSWISSSTTTSNIAWGGIVKKQMTEEISEKVKNRFGHTALFLSYELRCRDE
jgi:hypothetical protein